MSEMLERVEQAIHDAGMAWCDSHQTDACPPAHVLARAAIEAMREPSQEMVLAGATAEMMPDCGVSDTDEWHEGDVGQAWRAMIDAALGTTSGMDPLTK